MDRKRELLIEILEKVLEAVCRNMKNLLLSLLSTTGGTPRHTDGQFFGCFDNRRAGEVKSRSE